MGHCALEDLPTTREVAMASEREPCYKHAENNIRFSDVQRKHLEREIDVSLLGNNSAGGLDGRPGRFTRWV